MLRGYASPFLPGIASLADRETLSKSMTRSTSGTVSCLFCSRYCVARLPEGVIRIHRMLRLTECERVQILRIGVDALLRDAKGPCSASLSQPCQNQAPAGLVAPELIASTSSR